MYKSPADQQHQILPLDSAGLTPQKAFTKVIEKLQSDETKSPKFSVARELLGRAGFSQNGRNRILHLSCEEIGNICANMPKDQKLWPSYVNEIHLLLSKMDQYRKLDSHMGRPYVTADLAFAIGKLYCLKHIEAENCEHIKTQDLRIFIMDHSKHEWFVRHIEQDQKASESTSGDVVSIQSAIRLLGLYRDELISLPRLKSKQALNEFELHEFEVGEFRLMDDGGESYFEAIRDIPVVTYFDELPSLDLVLDWFVVTKPILDDNRLKRGWLYLEKLSDAWHKQCIRNDSLKELISAYPGWNCAVADNKDAWINGFPLENPYKIVPLNTPQKLWKESQVMKHCVVTYLGSCICGQTRIFSIRDAHDDPVGTAELTLQSGQWNLVQLKGKHNKELMHRSFSIADPLAIALRCLVRWYNDL